MLVPLFYGSWPQILSFIKHIKLIVNLFINKLKFYDLKYQKIQMVIIKKVIFNRVFHELALCGFACSKMRNIY
jgi:hypothetical protein